MKLNIIFRHLESTPSLEEKIREKANHLKKYFKGDVEINWVCSVNKDTHCSDVNVHAKQHYFHASAEDDCLYKTMDEVLVKIERQLRKKSRKIQDKILHPQEVCFAS